jgi:phage terminase large subunit
MQKLQTTKVFSEIRKAVDDGFTTVSLQGSSRSSKTYNTLIWLIAYCLNHRNTRLSVVRATLPALKGSVFIDFREILMNMLLFDEKALNKTEMTYHFPNGSWVEFFSTDSEQKLRGRKRDILFVNEANELNFIEWQQLKMRTSQLAIVDYNPSFTDEHWLCQLNRESRTKHIITTYKDNPFLEQTVIDEIESLKHKNESLWKIYGLGIQAEVEGIVFRNVETVDCIPDYVKKRWGGLDFGFTNDPTAILDVGLFDNCLYLDEICYRTQMLSSDIVRVLKAECSHLKKFISESADPRLIQEIYRAGINIHPVKKFQGSVEAGIAKMLEYRICVTKRSLNALKEFRNYTYCQDKEGKWLNEPIDAYNHAIDAARYVVISEVLGGERKPANLSRLVRNAY